MSILVETKAGLSLEKKLDLKQPNDSIDLRQPFTAEEERKVIRKIDLVILPLVSRLLRLLLPSESPSPFANAQTRS